MFRPSSSTTLVKSAAILVGLLVAACGGSNPTGPSATVPLAAPPATGTVNSSAASVSGVLPTSLAPSVSDQTILVSGANFQPGLSVTLTLTGTPPAAARGMQSIAAAATTTTTFTGSAIHNLTDTSFELVVSVQQSGTYNLCVTNPSAPPSVPVTITATPSTASRPTLVGLSPSSPTQSTTSQVVYLAGAGFQPGLSAVFTAPNGATSTVGGAGVTEASSTIARVWAVLAEAGQYAVKVANPDGQTSEPWTFTVKPSEPTVPRPAVTGLSPSSPGASTASQVVYLSGTNFQAGLSVVLTSPGGSPAPVAPIASSDVTSTAIRLSVTLQDAGTYTVKVANPGGQASEPWGFTVKAAEPPAAARPTVAGLSPSSPTASTVAQRLYVSGTDFASGLTVLLTAPGGTATTLGSSAINFGSPTVFSMTATLAAAGNYSVKVVNPGGQASEPFSFSVKPAEPAVPQPTVTGISPSSPTQSTASQVVYLTGAGFQSGLSVALTSPGGSAVSVGTIGASDVSSTAIRLTVTLHDAGTYTVKVTNPGGQPSTPWTFAVRAAEPAARPSITGLSPVSPTQNAAAQHVYVSGTNFVSGLTALLTAPGGGMTTLGSSAISFGSSTVFSLTVTLSSPGSYTLKVVNPGGATSEPWAFTVAASELPRPSVSGVTAVGGNPPLQSATTQVLTVTGANFQSDLTAVLTAPSGATTTISGTAVLNRTSTSFAFYAAISEAGHYGLRVTNPHGQASEPFTFNVAAPATPVPTVTGLSPRSPVQGTASQTVYVVGTSFASGLSVTLTLPNGTTRVLSATQVQNLTATVFTIATSFEAAGAWTLRVTTSAGTSVPWTFTVVSQGTGV